MADARALPTPFIGRIDDLRVLLPWGSLLRAVLAAEPSLVDLVASGLGPGGRARIVVSVTPADEQAVGAPVSDGELGRPAAALAAAGLDVIAPRPYEAADASDLRSSWAKRLGVPAMRRATILEVRRPHEASYVRDAERTAAIIAASANRSATPQERDHDHVAPMTGPP